ncbi:hypothetical protein PMAYCL1PPCAC_05271 [Pristionchus mayeri]|uniref:Uncharacterized protein n=1 Tax=Pristionchus mayeri TaxID=1317129 RepID=A0AAN5CBG1_9BILA|nr:hypothetical protein PMAYCL1PPCAC_05271 [Pristionchus mayeri]
MISSRSILLLLLISPAIHAADVFRVKRMVAREFEKFEDAVMHAYVHIPMLVGDEGMLENCDKKTVTEYTTLAKDIQRLRNAVTYGKPMKIKYEAMRVEEQIDLIRHVGVACNSVMYENKIEGMVDLALKLVEEMINVKVC